MANYEFITTRKIVYNIIYTAYIYLQKFTLQYTLRNNFDNSLLRRWLRLHRLHTIRLLFQGRSTAIQRRTKVESKSNRRCNHLIRRSAVPRPSRVTFSRRMRTVNHKRRRDSTWFRPIDVWSWEILYNCMTGPPAGTDYAGRSRGGNTDVPRIVIVNEAGTDLTDPTRMRPAPNNPQSCDLDLFDSWTQGHSHSGMRQDRQCITNLVAL